MEIPGFSHLYSGKIRDLYTPEAPEFQHLVLVVASDRISAFDTVHSPEIPGKGENLTGLTNFWFDRLDVPNHRSDELLVPEIVKDRAMIAKRLDMYPVECVVRGYISGSGWSEYLETGAICDVKLPAGLQFGDKLPEPIFTPAFKAELGEKDQNINFEATVKLVGKEIAEKLRETSLKIFEIASHVASESGLILADTKFEFGNDPKTNVLTLGDEVLTPDSSRFWDQALWIQGVRDQSFDKQGVRNWLKENWDLKTAPPVLPNQIVSETSAKYEELSNRLGAI
ncbi:MAG: phosphoribosylaminoimidazolesuccinocarboxamide synthase [Actinomycetales bacterium]